MWEGLQFLIVALPGLFSYRFWYIGSYVDYRNMLFCFVSVYSVSHLLPVPWVDYVS